jgi:predicted nucleotidyltransferase
MNSVEVLEMEVKAKTTFKKINPKMDSMKLAIQRIPENKRRALESFVKVLKEKYGDRIHKIILFGSTARGEAEEESDVDILIIADGVTQKEVSKIAFQILLKYGVVISSIVEDKLQFEKYKDYSFHRNILKEGVKIG